MPTPKEDYIVVQETTDWSDSPHKVPNHTYFLSLDKQFCFGYIKSGKKRPVWFSKKLPFSPARRTFKILRTVKVAK
jgi:hypothetical protein